MTPINKLSVKNEPNIMKNMKYLFHALVIVLYPTSLYRFFFKFGTYPWNDIFICIYIAISGLFIYMADWSFRCAK